MAGIDNAKVISEVVPEESEETKQRQEAAESELVEELAEDQELAKEALGLQALNRPAEEPKQYEEPAVIADDEGAPLPEYRFVEAEKVLKANVPEFFKTTLENMHEEGYGFISHSAFEGYRSLTVDLLLVFRLED